MNCVPFSLGKNKTVYPSNIFHDTKLHDPFVTLNRIRRIVNPLLTQIKPSN